LALCACATLATGTRASAANFGAPPSGDVPIFFDDQHVYASPDVLTHARVLAALVKDGEIYVPLRSMFEALGATVTVSPDGRTVTADKPGARVSVRVGDPHVVINGESRPLDVPPIVVAGVVLVPVRVLSEGLGAYVAWLPDRRAVVVRYVPPAVVPPPTPAPTVAPTAAPTAAPTPAPPLPTAMPTEKSYTAFVQAAYSRPNNANEFVAGGFCDSFIVNVAYAPIRSKFAVKADARQDTYVTSNNAVDAFGNHYTQFATIDGGTAFTPVFFARQTTLDVRLEYQVAAPRVYVGLGYLHASTNYGYPALDAVGFGIEKLPDLRPGIGVYGSVFDYPSASGTYSVGAPTSPDAGASYTQRYAILTYDVGATLVARHVPVYLFGGYGGNRYTVKQNAPIGQTHSGPYIGLGVKI